MDTVGRSRRTPALRLALLGALKDWFEWRRTQAAIADLDDRLREDIGLEPLGQRPPEPGEVAAHLALLAGR